MNWSDLRVFFIGGYCNGANDVVSLWLASLKNLGAHVSEFSTDQNRDALDCKGRPHDYGYHGPVYLREEVLAPALASFRPHWVFCCAGGLSFTPHASAHLRGRYCLTGIALSDPDAFFPSTQHIAGNFDRYFTNSLSTVDLYRKIGVSARYLTFACYPPYHRKLPPSPNYSCEVLFIGDARADRVDLVKQIAGRFDTRVFGFGWEKYDVPNGGFLNAEEFIKAVNSASLCVDFARNRAGDLMVKNRIFEFAGCGAVTCTERFADLEQFFQSGQEVLLYDTSEDLISLIRKCLDDPSLRNRISENAYRRSRAEHTYTHRWTEAAAWCGLNVARDGKM